MLTCQHISALRCSTVPYLVGDDGLGQGVEHGGVAWGGVRHAEAVTEVWLHNVAGQPRAPGVCTVMEGGRGAQEGGGVRRGGDAPAGGVAFLRQW